jgi:hypothetical protein
MVLDVNMKDSGSDLPECRDKLLICTLNAAARRFKLHRRARMETYRGYIKTQDDAIKLFEACHLGYLTQLDCRPSRMQLESIRPGSVFVWDNNEIKIKRWMDCRKWDSARKSGGFLIYRELEKGTCPPRYKPNGLIKQVFSRRAYTGEYFRLVSYEAGQSAKLDLPRPTTDTRLRNIFASKIMYVKWSASSFPLIARGLLQKSRITSSCVIQEDCSKAKSPSDTTCTSHTCIQTQLLKSQNSDVDSHDHLLVPQSPGSKFINRSSPSPMIDLASSTMLCDTIQYMNFETLSGISDLVAMDMSEIDQASRMLGWYFSL